MSFTNWVIVFVLLFLIHPSCAPISDTRGDEWTYPIEIAEGILSAATTIIKSIGNRQYTGPEVLGSHFVSYIYDGKPDVIYKIPVAVMLYAGENARCGQPSLEATDVSGEKCREQLTKLVASTAVKLVSYSSGRIIDGVFGLLYGTKAPKIIEHEEFAYTPAHFCRSYFNMLVSSSKKDIFSSLAASDMLTSPNRKYHVIMGHKCSLQLYSTEHRRSQRSILWESSGTMNEEFDSGCFVYVQNDGNMVIYNKGFKGVVWTINNSCKSCSYQSVMEVGNNGRLTFYKTLTKQLVWSTK